MTNFDFRLKAIKTNRSVALIDIHIIQKYNICIAFNNHLITVAESSCGQALLSCR